MKYPENVLNPYFTHIHIRPSVSHLTMLAWGFGAGCFGAPGLDEVWHGPVAMEDDGFLCSGLAMGIAMEIAMGIAIDSVCDNKVWQNPR